MKILIISKIEFLNKKDNGGKQCSNRNYMLLQKLYGKENIFICMFSNSIETCEEKHIKSFPTHHNKIEQIIHTVGLRNGYSAKTERKVQKYIEELQPEIIFLDGSMIGSLAPKIKNANHIILFMHNIETNYMRNRVKNVSVLFYIPYISYTYNEKRAIQVADKIICLNERDSQQLQQIYRRKADFLLPVSFEDIFDEQKAAKLCNKQPEEKIQLLFVGSLFPPNYDGIFWFAKEIMTQLKEYRLLVVGKNMEQKKDELESENVRVIGTVENIEDYYYQADAVVMPIFYGDGMKVKTAEAMMYGKTIFATAEALEGYYGNNVNGLYECNSKNEFLGSIKIHFESGNNLKSNLNIRQYFLEHFESNLLFKSFKKFLEVK